MKKLLATLFFCISITALAQDKPAYSVAEITFINKEAYQRDLWPKIQKLAYDAGADILVSGGLGGAITGLPKIVDKVTIIRFKSLQQAKNFYASKSYQDIKPIVEKTVKIRLYIVEGQ